MTVHPDPCGHAWGGSGAVPYRSAQEGSDSREGPEGRMQGIDNGGGSEPKGDRRWRS